MNLLPYLPGQTRILLCLSLMLALCDSLNAAEMQAPANKAVADTKVTCADFLDKLNRKPKNLEFIGCEKMDSLAPPALESRYRVKGANAKEVEAFLVKTAHMSKLGLSCCLWEPHSQNLRTQQPWGAYRSGGHRYMVTMSSEETLVTDRSHWGDIPYFYVTVRLYSDE